MLARWWWLITSMNCSLSYLKSSHIKSYSLSCKYKPEAPWLLSKMKTQRPGLLLLSNTLTCATQPHNRQPVHSFGLNLMLLLLLQSVYMSLVLHKGGKTLHKHTHMLMLWMLNFYWYIIYYCVTASFVNHIYCQVMSCNLHSYLKWLHRGHFRPIFLNKYLNVSLHIFTYPEPKEHSPYAIQLHVNAQWIT